MKLFKYTLVLTLALLFLMPQTSHAQLKGLRDRLQKRAEAKIEREIEERTTQRLENELNKAIDKTVENMADNVENSIEGMIFSDEPPPPIELEDNETGAADAPYVSYTIATRIQIGGTDIASRMLQRFGTQDEKVYIYGNKQRADENAETSQIMDAEGKQIIHLDHKKKEWWAMSFEEMFESLDQMKADVAQAYDDSDMSTNVQDVKFTIDRTGKTEMVNGTSAEQVIMTVEGTYETTIRDAESNEEATMSGTSYIVMDHWLSKEVAGYQTMMDFQKATAEAFGDAMSGTGFASMMSAFQSSPQLQEAAENAAQELGPDDGLAVRTKTYYVQVPEGGTLDKDAVLSGSSSDSPDEFTQRTIMTLVTEIGNLSTKAFDESMLAPTEGYKQIESPMKSFSSEGNR